MKKYEDPDMDLINLDDKLKSGYDVNSDDDETGYGPLIG